MRSADVPARVVSGYLGGRRINPLTGSPYLELRQSDAHAWVEVWLEGTGWQQVDPTLWADRNAFDNGNQGQQRTELTGLIEPIGRQGNWVSGCRDSGGA